MDTYRPSDRLRVTAEYDRLPKKARMYAGRVGQFVKFDQGYIVLSFNGDQAAYQPHEVALVVGKFDVYAVSTEGTFAVGRYEAESAEVAKQIGEEMFRIELKNSDPMLRKQKWVYHVEAVK